RVRDSLLVKGFLSPMPLGEIAPSPWFLDRLLWRPRRLGLSPAVRAFVLKRDGYACVYCHADDQPLHVDHVIPVTTGGTDEIENLATACQPCNLSKGAKMLADWRPDLAGRPQ
ncbi:MAG TPA: HNH endonuclease, partial [Caulobacteraceae bacterium]